MQATIFTGISVLPIFSDTLESALAEEGAEAESTSGEKVLDIVYQPQAVFRVQPVTRCTGSLPGHGEPVISVQFSPDGRFVFVLQKTSAYNLI